MTRTDEGDLAPLTWREFKQLIDQQLEEQGISEDVFIEWIDISLPTKGGHKRPEVGYSDGSIAIS